MASSTLLVCGKSGPNGTGEATGDGTGVWAFKETALANVASAHRELFMQKVR
jgi:hypothetical protein